MKHRNQKKRVYQVPRSASADVLYEQALLADSVRMLLYVDELENINKTAGSDEDFYFEVFEF